ncbi:C315R protein [African swine fever virus]|uniref:C315R protein n=1 Tax=African swine fever virus TaxID=10497 RepID=A0A650FZI5_ASF|nr:C315R protein [African swine fever virus]
MDALLKEIEKLSQPSLQKENNDVCDLCFMQMKKISNYQLLCEECGQLKDWFEPEYNEKFTIYSRLKIVGANSSYHQRDLDKANSSDYSSLQFHHILEELKSLNVKYMDAGQKPFPIQVLKETAHSYNQVQQHRVIRSITKLQILASILRSICLKLNIACTVADAARFTQLNTKGISRGMDLLRSLFVDNKITLNVDLNPIDSFINSTYSALQIKQIHQELQEENVYNLKEIVKSFILYADEKNIGVDLNRRTVVIATMYNVLRRAYYPIEIDTVVYQCKIRKNTITRALKMYEDYYSHFKSLYEQYHLNAAKKLI